MTAAASGAADASKPSQSLFDWEGRQANSVLLNGNWEFSPGDGREQAGTAEAPIAGGRGTVFFSQLDIQHRVDRSRPEYDPVAEKVLIDLLGKKGRANED